MAMILRQEPPKLLSEISAELKDGDQVRERCPFCNGGTTRELSFSMRRDGNTARYICYRASCGVSGSVSYGGVPTTTTIKKRKSVSPERYNGEMERLRVKDAQYFKNKYNIVPELLHSYSVKSAHNGRIVFPILSPNGISRGDNLRYYADLDDGVNFGVPKAVIYSKEGSTLLSWHRLSYTLDSIRTGSTGNLAIPDFYDDLLVVVEDQTSAIKASRLVDCVALMGTNLSMQKTKEISDEIGKHGKYKKVVLLLDEDAYGTAIKHLLRTRALLPNITVRRLVTDIKDMDYVDMNRIFSYLRNPQEM